MGCVYILKNPAMPDLIKIGYTNRAAEVRARELYDGMNGVPKPFIVVHINDCEEPQELEAIVHKRLARYRINRNREFFRYPADDAYELLQNLYKESQQGRKLLPIWERIKKSKLAMATIANLIAIPIANFLWGSVLKPIGMYIWNLLRQIPGPH